MTLSSKALNWIEGQVGGQVVAVHQQVRWRPHYFVTLDQGGGREKKVLARGERAGEPIAKGTMMDVYGHAREAQIVEALQGHGLRIPGYYGYSAEFGIFLIDQVEGTNLLAEAPDDAARASVMKKYYEELAKLHAIDIETMTLGGDIKIPRTPEEIAFAGKYHWTLAAHQQSKGKIKPEPLLNLGIWWLRNNVPQGERKVSFLQGDTGPGQFMYHKGEITALIDWELAHIGDPMLDLGVGRMRNMLYPAGSLREPIAHYEEVSGRAIDWQALSFYSVASMLLTPIGVAESVQFPSAQVSSTIARFGWYVTLCRGLTDALAEALDIETETPALPETGTGPNISMAGFLAEYLELNCRSMARNDLERDCMATAIAVAKGLKLESEVGRALLEDDLSDMALLLGKRPKDRDEGYVLLDAMVDNEAANVLVDFVRVFSRIERRREFVCGPMFVEQAAAPFERLAPPRSA